MRISFPLCLTVVLLGITRVYGAVGIGPHFPGDTPPKRVIGLRYTLRIDRLEAGSTGLILFGHMRFHGSAKYKTHFIEANITNGWVEYEDLGSVPWPPSRNGIDHPHEGGFAIAVSDYSCEGFVGARPRDRATYLQFPRMNTGIDNIPGLTKIEMISQQNMLKTEVYLEVVRGRIVRFASPQDHWGGRYMRNEGKQVSLDKLPAGTYQTWNVRTAFGGVVYRQAVLLPADQAEYFHPGQLIAFVTEFYELQKSHIRTYIWNPQLLREDHTEWESIRKWKRGYQANVDPYGPRLQVSNGRHVLEISNDRDANSYMRKGEIVELKANPVVEWEVAESRPAVRRGSVLLGITMDQASDLPVRVKIRASELTVGAEEVRPAGIFEVVIPKGRTRTQLAFPLYIDGTRRSGDQVHLAFVSAMPASFAGQISHVIRLGPPAASTEWIPPKAAPLEAGQGLAMVEKLRGKTAGALTATGLPREIDLSSRPVTDRALLRLRRLLEHTTSLNLSGCRKITDAGLVHLGNCVHLRELKLADLSIDGKGLKCLANMAVLEHLNLALCNMLTDEGLEHVGRLRKLQSLDLASTGVTGPGLQSIRSLTELRVLNLLNLPVTDVDLGRALSQMTRLEHLYLGGTKVTDGGVDRVRRRLPKIKIHR